MRHCHAYLGRARGSVYSADSMTKLRIGRYGFDLANKLPSYSHAYGDAYAADPHADHPGGICALLLSHRMPTRIDMFDALDGGKAGVLQGVFDYEVVSLGTEQKLG